MQCGGYTTGAGSTASCYGFETGADNKVKAGQLSILPEPILEACHGSDGTRLAVAGGIFFDSITEEFIAQDKVLLLDNPVDGWVLIDSPGLTSFGNSRGYAAGVLVGDNLLCIGGEVDSVSQNMLCQAVFCLCISVCV